MRRSDRLFELVRILRDGRLHRAGQMAGALNVSQRTIYRDMDTLIGAGVPVAGARGRGYTMTSPVMLPPLNLSMAELEALHLGVAVLTEAADPQLQVAARSLAGKIDAVLPENRPAPGAGWGFARVPFADAAAGFRHMPLLRSAIRERRKLRITYREPDGDAATSVMQPLQLEYWGRIWTMSVWCEIRNDIRLLRIERIRDIVQLPETFDDTHLEGLRNLHQVPPVSP
ncbi:MAG: helix-turn-helix transcriptional regulator [Paracoccaceae bacterium]